MATAITSQPESDDPFDLGLRTPINLNVAARNALLRNSAGTAESEILAIRGLSRRPTVASSPLNPNAAAAEGAQRDIGSNALETNQPQPAVTITESATRLVRETAQIHETKIAVFRAFCNAFDETAKQFTSGHAFRFAQEFSQSFIESWDNTLHGVSKTPSSTRPSYAAVASNRPDPAAPFACSHANRAPQPPALTPDNRPQIAPPKEDPRIFIRLNDDSSSWNRESYAIRAHIASRLTIELGRVPQASRTKTGWAVRAADLTTRNLVISRQSEWIEDLGASKADVSQKWYTYIVDECPKRLFDLQG
ncbi:MAG: hypothetical protein ACRERD_00585, partial [Candidatus Binatia bacterium]